MQKQKSNTLNIIEFAKSLTYAFLLSVIIFAVGMAIIDYQENQVWTEEPAFYDTEKQKLYYNATEEKDWYRFHDSLLISADAGQIQFEDNGYIWICNLSEVDQEQTRTELNISKRKADLVSIGGM